MAIHERIAWHGSVIYTVSPLAGISVLLRGWMTRWSRVVCEAAQPDFRDFPYVKIAVMQRMGSTGQLEAV